jgi:hypothetical protein
MIKILLEGIPCTLAEFNFVQNIILMNVNTGTGRKTQNVKG